MPPDFFASAESKPSPRDALLSHVRELEREIQFHVERFTQRTGLHVEEIQVVSNYANGCDAYCGVRVRAVAEIAR